MHFDGDAETLFDGPTSTVTRIVDGPRVIAVKTSTAAHAKEPHDVLKEARLLASLSHPNIVPLIKHAWSPSSQDLNLWMPYIPYSLDQLLRSSRCSPHPIISFGNAASSSSPTPREIQFVVLAKSIVFQVLCGVSYLHADRVRIAHRDIKPNNVLLAPSGRVQLIDFGIAFRAGEDRAAKAKDVWPEPTTRMYFEVSTGPYRAPELLFGPRTYDAFAIDAWSLGATIAEFFTSLVLQTDDDDDNEEAFFQSPGNRTPGSDSGSDAGAPAPPPTPFVIPRRTGTDLRPGIPTGRWTRASLFDATRGEIGLAWSIFQIRGTPDADNWPSFSTLPDANKLAFIDVGASDLALRLPNLPPSTTRAAAAPHTDTPSHAPPLNPVPSPLDLVHRFLVYEPARRLTPSAALHHPWFSAEPGLVFPPADNDDDDDGQHLHAWAALETGVLARPRSFTFVLEGQTRTLGDLLSKHLAGGKH